MAYTIPEITEAIHNGEIQAYYQPQYDALTNKLTGAEALARWIKPDGTLIYPGEFVPVLEETKEITQLDWHMCRSVCDFLRRQREQGIRQVPISVNFSRWHADDQDFVQKLCAMAHEYGVEHRLLIVEVTESALVDHGERIADLVENVRKAGFLVALDDFGSGLSALSFVKDIAMDELKLDKSLLSRNCEDEKERIVLESIFTFAHRLKLTTVEEGVETREQLGFLRTCGCKVIQGFMFAKPMPEEEFWRVCEKRRPLEDPEDILTIQPSSSALQLLMDAIFIRYPLVIYANLTRNSFYMMAYDSFSSRSCPSTGVFDELIQHGATTMAPEDQQLFTDTFSIPNLMAAYERGDKSVRVVTRQRGDDGIYRRVETTDYFVKNPSVDDVLLIALCQNLED